MSAVSGSDCSACGTCCRKGGPVLHHEDAPLVEKILPFRQLVTLRAGELAYEPVTGQLVPLESEVIKVAGTGAELTPWQCVFLEGSAHCRIYADRPAQCRALFCKDTAALEALYTQRRLTREDIFATAPAGWLGLARAHEEDCALPPLAVLARQALDDSQAAERLLEAARFDAAFRELCTAKAHISAEVLPCLLGRPLPHFLASFGLVITGEKLERMGLRLYP